MRFLNDPALPEPDFPGSHMVLDDRYVFLSGLVAADIDGGDACVGDIRAETELVLRSLERMLGTVDCRLEHAVRVDVHLADLSEIDAMDAVYRGFFAAGRYPARTCTESPHLCGGCRVEITVMARRAGLRPSSA